MAASWTSFSQKSRPISVDFDYFHPPSMEPRRVGKHKRKHVTDDRPEKGTNEEFLRLWLQYESRIYGMVFSLVPDWAGADDVMQEVSLVLWRRFDEFELGTSFLAWAFTVARYQALAYRKKQRAQQARLSTETVEQVAAKIVDTLQESSCEREDALGHCLGRLRERDRELVQLRYQPGATTEAVAEAVGKTRAAVYKALSRVHSRLLDCVERYLSSGGRRGELRAH